MPNVMNLCEKIKNLWGRHDLDRTHRRTDARTDRVITIGRLPQSGGGPGPGPGPNEYHLFKTEVTLEDWKENMMLTSLSLKSSSAI